MTGTNKHLTYEDRLQLLSFVSKNYSMRKIGTILGKAPSSISRELKLNRYRKHRFNESDGLCIHARTCPSIKRGCSQTCSLYRIDVCTRLTHVLCDRGSEFSKPNDMETLLKSKTVKAHVFYCNPQCPQQKGKLEKNHEYIRMFVPKGKSFKNLSQAQINHMMNHINSVKRDSLGGKSPFEVLSKSQKRALKKLGYNEISPDKVILSSSLFKK
ncbi:MAG: helix-turn-helix domain-containing protein [Erysipelotrichaceae bacterium]